jgi:hypothetical protein
MEPYTLEDLSPEEAKAIQTELTAVLEKYNCDMTVSSRIEILKRVPTKPNGVQTEQSEQEEATETSTIQ